MLPFLSLLMATGCTFQEHLPQVDVHGTVVIPRAAATRDIENPRTGEIETGVDPRMIGPIWMGAFPNVEPAGSLFDYPHPEMGPVFLEGVPGNTYPYGGGSVGRFAFGCFQSVVCEIVTGRFTDYDDVLDYFNNIVQDPIVDEFGADVESSAFYQSYCLDLFNFTADYELDFISGEDLDFTENNDGDFESSFDLWQVQYFQNMKVWGWMDAPNEGFLFSTCNDAAGQENTEYTSDYRYGSNYTNILNFPSNYIFAGDYVVDEPPEFTAEDADAFRDEAPEPVIRFGHVVE